MTRSKRKSPYISIKNAGNLYKRYRNKRFRKHVKLQIQKCDYFFKLLPEIIYEDNPKRCFRYWDDCHKYFRK